MGTVLDFERNLALKAAIGSLSTVHELCHTLLNGLNRTLHSRLPLDPSPLYMNSATHCLMD
jgi:hypothetical protein